MYQNCCKKCGSISLHTEVKGSNIGLYCDDCGAWVKWLGKNELRAFEHGQKENNKSSNKDITARLKEFIEFLEKKIDSEYNDLPNSKDDLMRKNVCCAIMLQSAYPTQNGNRLDKSDYNNSARLIQVGNSTKK